MQSRADITDRRRRSTDQGPIHARFRLAYRSAAGHGLLDRDFPPRDAVRRVPVTGLFTMKKLVNPRSRLTLTLADVARRLPPRWLPAISTCIGEALYRLRRSVRSDEADLLKN